jgi:muramoyltetrapeptide carboxypeptidase
MLSDWGLTVEVGDHAFDREGHYLAGRDEDRLADLNDAVGWACPSFAGAILLIEDIDKFIGGIDRGLTQLLRSGVLDGLKGVAVGQFIRSAEPSRGKWSVLDVLRDRLLPLGVPVLGGLPIGHGPDPWTIPLGTMATLDTTAGTLTIEPGVE